MRSRVFLFVAATLLLVGPTFAGGFGLYASYWATDDLEDTAGVGVKWAVGDEALRLELRGSYFPDLSNDIRDLGDDPVDVDVEAIVPEAGVAFNFAPDGRFQPYVGAGLSYYILELEGAGPFAPELDDQVGFYALGGFETGGDGPSFFAEAMYRSVEGTVVDDSIVGDIDLDLSGLSVNAGVGFEF